MPVPITCTCSVCHKCKNRERMRRARQEKNDPIKMYGRGVLKLNEIFHNKDLSLKDIYYGPSFPGSTLDPNRMFLLRDAKDF